MLQVIFGLVLTGALLDTPIHEEANNRLRVRVSGNDFAMSVGMSVGDAHLVSMSVIDPPSLIGYRLPGF